MEANSESSTEFNEPDNGVPDGTAAGDPVSDAPAAPPEPGNFLATPGLYYRATHLLMGVLLIGFGVWCGWDGFVNWPRANEHATELDARIQQLRTEKKDADTFAKLVDERKEISVHSDLDLTLQRFLAVALPLGGIAMLVWTLYNSRGAYKLDGEKLSIPGHPPMKLGDITGVNRTRWERKGIAYVEYTVDEVSGRFRLDDFVYERDATDAIFDRITLKLLYDKVDREGRSASAAHRAIPPPA